jgi:LmbE family N-acetylglucosaminyl deacetylase
MLTIHILSPHQDDACLSLGLSIAAWRKAGVDFHLVNCFSQSDYAPFSGVSGREAVSLLREAEDRAFREAIGICRTTNLDLLDAALRGKKVMRSGKAALKPDPAATGHLTEILSTLVPSGFLVAPLAIGQHLDHIIVRDAALRLNNVRLGFYEDLPYAGDIESDERVAFAEGVAQRLGRPLTARVFRVDHAIQTKLDLLSAYASQFGRGEGLGPVRRVTAEYGGGERLWSEDALWEVLQTMPVLP